MTFPQPDFDDSDDFDFPIDLPFEQEEEEVEAEVEAENEGTWPAAVPTTPTWGGKRRRFDHEHRLARERQAALRRQEVLQRQLQRLDAEEAAISAQWAALPSPPSPLRRILIALGVLGCIVALLHCFPLLLVPLFVIGLAMAKLTRRPHQLSRQRHVWARQERDRLESRWSGIVAERRVIEQQLASIKSELSQFVLP